jgi:para-aminobenzoate synthetase
LRCLIIDNYDSFTWNLADQVSRVFGDEPMVVRNDRSTWRELTARFPFDCVIVSPGPGSAAHPGDLNVSRDALEQEEYPVLGVCLGHQGLAYVHGGRIEPAPVPYHGRTSIIHHDGSALFRGLPPRFEAMRYHSLQVSRESLPDDLAVSAWTEDGLVMGLRHRSRPKWGVQFHPESILTRVGLQIIANFRDEAQRWAREPGAGRSGASAREARGAAAKGGGRRTVELLTRRLPAPRDAEQVFRGLFADGEQAFWLDSQTAGDGAASFSYMGSGRGGSALTFRAGDDGPAYLDALERAIEGCVVSAGEQLPFDFRGGYVGYMTYEMKAAFGAATRHRNPTPEAVWMWVDRFLAFDHAAREIWIVALADPDDGAAARRWLSETEEALRSLPRECRPARPPPQGELTVSMAFGRDEYIAAIERCKQKIVDGESYEICLTSALSFAAKLDPLELYFAMRAGNPAPFGAYLRAEGCAVLSTSPERFLRVTADGNVQTKPIKGTSARSEDPRVDRERAARLQASEKERAENLMIVDLMRNDLRRVSLPGSVRVPRLLEVESYRTVHQLVSTVEATLAAECSLVDLLRAAFPGGSITGAPKLRAMEIIDAIEPTARGVYCGTIGYLGYGRVADLNIAIRTLSYDGATVRFGAGGAITYLSRAEDELEEVLLKAEAVLRPIWRYLQGDDAPFEYQLRGRTLSISQPGASGRG